MFDSHPNCTLCPLHASVKKNVGIPTIHYGLPPSPTTPALFFIGMNPGYYEDINNEPFFPVERLPSTGRPNSGYILREQYIRPLGIASVATIYISNIVRCGPDPKPPAKSVVACYPYLDADLCSVVRTHCHSRVGVVLLGEFAAVQFFRRSLGLRGITVNDCRMANGQEWAFADDGNTITTFTTYHPAGVLRKGSLITSVDEHMELAADFIKGTLVPATPPNIIPNRAPRTK